MAPVYFGLHQAVGRVCKTVGNGLARRIAEVVRVLSTYGRRLLAAGQTHGTLAASVWRAKPAAYPIATQLSQSLPGSLSRASLAIHWATKPSIFLTVFQLCSYHCTSS
jgi:hypothetical protein